MERNGSLLPVVSHVWARHEQAASEEVCACGLASVERRASGALTAGVPRAGARGMRARIVCLRDATLELHRIRTAD
eukprot:1159419-Prymnesium_polylepis.1